MDNKEILKLARSILDDLEYPHMTGEWAYDHKGISRNIDKYYKELEALENQIKTENK